MSISSSGSITTSTPCKGELTTYGFGFGCTFFTGVGFFTSFISFKGYSGIGAGS